MKTNKKIDNSKLNPLVGIVSIVLLIIMSCSLVIAEEDPPDAFYKSFSDNPIVKSVEDTSIVDSFSVSLFSGTAVYSHPIDIPKGTNDLQPLLSIFYNHQATSKP